MRLRSILTPAFLALTALLLCAGTAHGQITGIRIDGDILDWPGGVWVDERYDVDPDQVDGVDVTSSDTMLGMLVELPVAVADSIINILPVEQRFPRLQFIFKFRFLAPVFADSVESGIELLFDTTLDRDVGQLLERWSASPDKVVGRFHPNTRIGIWGQAGRITRLTKDTWDGGAWVRQAAGSEMAGIAVAHSELDLEGAIEFGVLGVERSNTGWWFFGWAAITTQGENHDYVPDGDTVDQHSTTPVLETSWGQVKGDVP